MDGLVYLDCRIKSDNDVLGDGEGQGKEVSLRSHTPTVLQPSETRAKLAPPTSRGEVLLLGRGCFC